VPYRLAVGNIKFSCCKFRESHSQMWETKKEVGEEESHNAAEMRRPQATTGNVNRFFPLPCTAGYSSLLL
jgi:hypothetical protein